MNVCLRLAVNYHLFVTKVELMSLFQHSCASPLPCEEKMRTLELGFQWGFS